MPNYRYDDIRKIMIVKVIVESGSMQKAAKEIKVTPSAISQSLSSLEKSLGTPLFLRDQGRLVATEACAKLLEKAGPALSALDSLFETKPEKVRIDYLDLGAYESLAHSVLSDFVRQLRAEHPQVRFNMVVSRTSELLKKLRTGELCTALVAETDGIDRLKLEEVAKDEMGLFLSKDFAYLAADWEGIRSLGFGLISTSSDGVPSYLKKFLKQLGPKPKITLTSDSYEVLRRAAVNGLAAAVLPLRVGQRSQNDLIEIKKFDGVEKKNFGEHKIYLASMDRCDEKESAYLASVARDCFQRESNNLRQVK